MTWVVAIHFKVRDRQFSFMTKRPSGGDFGRWLADFAGALEIHELLLRELPVFAG